MIKRLPSILLLCLVMLTSTGCYRSVEQQLYQGNYDEVLSASLDKIARSRKRDDFIAIALKAYDKVSAEDRYRINTLKAQNADGRNWGKIYYTYLRMSDRQEQIAPFLPLTYEDGSTVDVPIYDLAPVLEEARESAAKYHYEQAVQLLGMGSRLAGRQAYDELREVLQYAHRYRDTDALLDSAVVRGTNKVLLNIRQDYDLRLPQEFLDALGYYDYEGQVHAWSRLYRQGADQSDFDYAVEVRVERAHISPEHIREVRSREERTVQDGTQPLIGADGQYVVDSTGAIIQVPRYKTLTCYVTEWTQHRSAVVESVVEIRHLRTGRLIVRQPLADEAIFEHSYASANGALDILPQEIRQKLRARPMAFPTDLDMLLMTSEGMREQIARSIRRNGDALGAI